MISFLSEGCSHASEHALRDSGSSPQALKQAYVDALKNRDSRAVYELLSESAQDRYTPAALQRSIESQQIEYEQLERELRVATGGMQAKATLHYSRGFSVVLPYEQGEFRVPARGLIPGSATTIEAALIQLTHALSVGSQDLLIAAYVKKKQVKYKGERESLLSALKDRDSAIVSRQGLRASVELSAGHRVLLSFEEGRWRVSEFH